MSPTYNWVTNWNLIRCYDTHGILSYGNFLHDIVLAEDVLRACVCEDVCVCERERESLCVCVCVCVCQDKRHPPMNESWRIYHTVMSHVWVLSHTHLLLDIIPTVDACVCVHAYVYVWHATHPLVHISKKRHIYTCDITDPYMQHDACTYHMTELQVGGIYNCVHTSWFIRATKLIFVCAVTIWYAGHDWFMGGYHLLRVL